MQLITTDVNQVQQVGLLQIWLSWTAKNGLISHHVIFQGDRVKVLDELFKLIYYLVRCIVLA